MNLDKVISGFFIILAMTLNFGFFYGDLGDLELHSKYELFAALVVNIIATTLKIGDKTQLGSVLLATSLVADIQLIASATIWTVATYAYSLDREVTSMIISLSGGALLANITSVLLYIGDTLKSKR
jgi:Ca2+/H+ antiporter, TMEM165/GDT1 family